MKEIKIMVCCHKQAELPKNDFFFPIYLGKQKVDINSSLYHFDNNNDNISSKNDSFCELTGHYWMWKNCNCDIIGLNHYRRYFDFNCKHYNYSPDRSFTPIKDFLNTPYQFGDIETILNKYDIILPPKRHWPYSLHTQYAIFHIINDWNILRNVIKEEYPEYLETFDNFFYNNNSLSNYNMFITRWNIFDDYSKWLFNILFKVEKKVKLSEYSDQKRLFGYLAERLINIYCIANNLKIKYIPVVMPLEDNNMSKNPSNLRYCLRRLKNDIFFKLTKIKD